MRTFYLKILLLSVLSTFLFAGRLHAQQYNFHTYTVAEGLAQSQVYGMCEDRRGNIWFGTQGGGLSRFDGINFHTVSEEDGLISNFVRCVIEAKDGSLWIGTDAGLSRYDGRSFTNYTDSILKDNQVQCLMQSRNGDIWIGTQQGGLSRYDGKRFTRYIEQDGLPQNLVTALFEDRDGTIWIGTERGLCRFRNDSFHTYTSADGLCSNIIRDIIQDQEGNLWISTYIAGVSKFDGRVFTTYDQRDGIAVNNVPCLIQDRKGNIWFGTGMAGVTRYDGEDFQTFTETEGLCSNIISDIIEDSQGNIWFGSSGGGVSRFDSERFVHFTEKNGKIGDFVYAIHEDTAHNIWFASSHGGVTRYDGMYYKNYRSYSGFTSRKVRCIHEDTAGNLWFGTIGDGAYFYDGLRFAHFTTREGLCGNFVNDITTDTAGNVWFATAGGGVCYYQTDSLGENGRFHWIRARDGIGSDRDYAILADREGTIWIGTQGGGLSRILYPADDSARSIVNYTLKDGLESNTVRSLLLDSNGRIWAGTAGGGVAWFDGERFHSFTKKNGLYSNNIYSMVLDAEQNLWAGSEKGVDKLVLNPDYTIKKTEHFSKAEGFMGIETVQNSVCLDHKGRLWFGTVNGTVMYNPAEDHPNPIPPKTHITGIRLFFDKIESTRFAGQVSPWYHIPDSLTLPYDQNHLSFDFIGINHRNPERVSYKYKLEGFDEEWSPPSDKSSATYSNLPPGEYTFKVMAANEDGVWNKEPETFRFSITAPFWETWWFRTAAYGGGALLLLLIFWLVLRQVRRQNAVERSKLKMEKNIVELEQQALMLQMNPHFIFNSLNSIQAYISRNDTASAKRYLAKFARLMRLILQNSREAYVPLEEEISMLRNYLDLERLCYNDKFDYTIEVAPGLQPEATGIPPMLIQPFVENAILHGILPREGEGHIHIRFKAVNAHIMCEVEDNGIGINEALKRRQQREDHASTAFTVTQKRLQLMQQTGISEAGIRITDLSEQGNGHSGTLVALHMPFQRW